MIEPRSPGAVEFAEAAERIGVDSLWVPEVWGYDALTGLAYVAAKTSTIKLGTFVVQLGSRSPAMLATSALSLQELSGGRFLLGRRHVGPAGDGGLARRAVPQAGGDDAGDHRDRPDRQPRGPARARRRDLSASAAGQQRRCPASRWCNPRHVPVYVAAMGPRNLRLTGEMADGWLGNAFIPEAAEVFLGPLREGAERAGRTLADLDLVAPVAVEIHDDEASADAAARRHADGYAFTIGAMGAGGRNFYNDAFTRLGYGDEVEKVAAAVARRASATKPAKPCRSTSAA